MDRFYAQHTDLDSLFDRRYPTSAGDGHIAVAFCRNRASAFLIRDRLNKVEQMEERQCAS